MKIYIGADHRGFQLKRQVKDWLVAEGYQVHDVGAPELVPNDDYPQYAEAVGQQVRDEKDSLGIVVCGSGVGVDVAANKVDGVRSAYAASTEEITAARRDDNVNVLAVAADFTDMAKAKQLIGAFLKTSYTPNERYERRIEEIQQIEEKN